jgi:hypothetical protein
MDYENKALALRFQPQAGRLVGGSNPESPRLIIGQAARRRPLWLPSARDLHETEFMTGSRVPSASEALDLMDALQRSEAERPVLQTSFLGGSYERKLRSPAGVERWPGAAFRGVELTEAQKLAVDAARRGEDSAPGPWLYGCS